MFSLTIMLMPATLPVTQLFDLRTGEWCWCSGCLWLECVLLVWCSLVTVFLFLFFSKCWQVSTALTWDECVRVFAACTLATLDTNTNTYIMKNIYTYNIIKIINLRVHVISIDIIKRYKQTLWFIINMDNDESNTDKNVNFLSNHLWIWIESCGKRHRRTVAPSTEQMHRKPILATERLTTSNIRRTKTSSRTRFLEIHCFENLQNWSTFCMGKWYRWTFLLPWYPM